MTLNDPQGTKRCRDCGQVKLLSEFRSSLRKYGRYVESYCRPCADARSRKWAKEHPFENAEIRRLYMQRYRLKKKQALIAAYRASMVIAPDALERCKIVDGPTGDAAAAA